MTALLNEFLLKKWDRQQQTTIAIFLASASGEHFCAGTDFIGEPMGAQSPTHSIFFLGRHLQRSTEWRQAVCKNVL